MFKRVLSVLIPALLMGSPAGYCVAEKTTQAYKTVPGKSGEPRALKLNINSPPGGAKSGSRPAIVFFFGGGWKSGDPRQFSPHCQHLASRGMVAITALSRFDKPAEQRAQDNLIILFADEGQEIITGAESAFADHRAAGVIREARATLVLATQAYTSLLGALDKRYADVLMLNLSNELIFTCANHDSAAIASKNIGEREVVEKSWGYAAGKASQNYSKKIKPFMEPFQLRKLPKFKAVIRHCEKPFRKRLIPPTTPNGSYPEWFTAVR